MLQKTVCADLHITYNESLISLTEDSRGQSQPPGLHDVAVDRPLPERVLPADVHDADAADVVFAGQKDKDLRFLERKKIKTS